NLIDLRFPVQYVIRPDLTFRGFAGTVASGVLRPGDEVMVLPSRKKSRVKSIVVDQQEVPEAFPPLAAVVTLEDEVDVSRGDMLVRPENLPRISHDIEAMLVWMNEAPLQPGREYFIKHTTSLVTGVVNRVHYKVDVNTLHRQPAAALGLNEIGRVQLSLVRPLAHDPYARNRVTGAFIIIDRLTNDTVAAGMIRASDGDKQAVQAALAASESPATDVTAAQRERLFGHKPGTVWLTGLPDSGKSSIARGLEKWLVDNGHACNVLDSSALRQGISRDLGFSGDDRQENVRRAAAVARLFNDAGLITIAALVSPFADDRQAARAGIGADRFIMVHCAAPADACEARDTSGAWARARAGEIPYFTGVSAPYEEPAHPDLRLATHELSVDACVAQIVALMRTRGLLRD
ncbi:MAG: adenylyl-sulfate kinase, partial [Planctomycetota bacterium]